MKQQSNTQKQGALMAIQTGCMLVFNEEYYFECLEIMISTSK